MNHRYVIGSGWWCSSDKGAVQYKDHVCVGHRFIRTPMFHNDVWIPVLMKYTKPVKVVIVDSNSPVKLSNQPEGFEVISLDRNYNEVPKTPFNGWLRGFMLGAAYAWNCDADFIYIEQDCLVIGEGWVDKIYEASMNRTKALYGKKYCSPIQQSLVFIPHHKIPDMLFHLSNDTKGTCEERFFRSPQSGVSFGILPFGVGRDRPVNFNARHYYAQRWTADELRELGRRLELIDVINKGIEYCEKDKA